jgi:hypothetical protein
MGPELLLHRLPLDQHLQKTAEPLPVAEVRKTGEAGEKGKGILNFGGRGEACCCRKFTRPAGITGLLGLAGPKN